MARDQRRHHRYEVDGVEGTLVLSHDARILNMSLTGLLVEATAPLRVGAGSVLRVAQPGGELRFDAEVRWCHLVGTRPGGHGQTRPVYQAGIDFRKTLDERARSVLTFLESHIIVELERRLAGRFRALEPIPAELSSDEPFEVCKLSLAGLLLRAERPPAFDSTVGLDIETPVGRVQATGRVRNLEQRTPIAAGTATGPAESWLVGVEFVALEPEARRTLTRFIEKLLA